MDVALSLPFLFAAIFLLNLIPAFAPPTWLAMSMVGLRHPDANPFLVALIAACAATSGRLVLAWFSHVIVHNRWFSAEAKANIEVVRQRIERRRMLTVGVLLLYAFSPLPSSYLFIAYGLTRLPLVWIAAPFFFGRLVSYTAWSIAAQEISRHLDLDETAVGGYLSLYFVLTQLAFILLVYLFAKFDWRTWLTQRRLGWIRRIRR